MDVNEKYTEKQYCRIVITEFRNEIDVHEERPEKLCS
jgi:hypothetical protein